MTAMEKSAAFDAGVADAMEKIAISIEKGDEAVESARRRNRRAVRYLERAGVYGTDDPGLGDPGVAKARREMERTFRAEKRLLKRAPGWAQGKAEREAAYKKRDWKSSVDAPEPPKPKPKPAAAPAPTPAPEAPAAAPAPTPAPEAPAASMATKAKKTGLGRFMPKTKGGKAGLAAGALAALAASGYGAKKLMDRKRG